MKRLKIFFEGCRIVLGLCFLNLIFSLVIGFAWGNEKIAVINIVASLIVGFLSGGTMEALEKGKADLDEFGIFDISEYLRHKYPDWEPGILR